MSETVSEITAVSYRRRDLLRAGAVGTFAIVAPRLLRGTEANSAVRVGLLGCGRRGSADATSIAQHTTARVVALADRVCDIDGATRSVSFFTSIYLSVDIHSDKETPSCLIPCPL